MRCLLRRAVLVFGPLALAACVTAPPTPAPVSDNVAVRALVAQAETDSQAGRRDSAVASLERALRIEPKNPRLWLELARQRFLQGDAAQAEQLAERALTWSGDDRELRAAGWRQIAEARAARGDAAGAREADERARGYAR